MNTIPLQETSHEIWEKKYRLIDDHGNPVDETIEDTYDRVASALARVEVDYDYWKERFAYALANGATPAGRILSNAGAEKYKPATSLINCLAGNTPVVTRQGIKPIKELAGKDVEILNGNGKWTTAPFKSFGEQETFKVTLRWGDNKKNKTEIHATKDHRWFLSDGRVVTTEFWMTGGLNNKTRTVPHLFVPEEQFVQDQWENGFIHGLVYGDGSASITENTYLLNLCGEKQEMVGLVKRILGKEPSVYENVQTSRFNVKSNINMKTVPSEYSYSYLRGFIAGVLATDGSVSNNYKGCEVVLCGEKELIDFIVSNSIYCGVVSTYFRKSAGRGQVTNYGARNKDLWVVALHPTTVNENDVIRTSHKRKFKKTLNGSRVINKWTVESVCKEPVMQEVFCCHEYETTAFAIANGMKTGQCVVSEIVEDRMDGILHSVLQSGLSLKAGCGIGYEFSTLRPKNAFVRGAGATTSGPLPFMDIFDKTCFTVSSAGGRRG